MKACPILFSTPMIQALLDGRKTQTRRVITQAEKLSYVVDCGDGVYGDEEGAAHFKCPYGKPGDLLWVRETWVRGHEYDESDMPKVGAVDEYIDKIWYRASSPELWWDNEGVADHNNPPWKPSIHMPRAASRLTLEITDIRVERLQDISQEDALAEGIRPMNTTIFNTHSMTIPQAFNYPNHNGFGWCRDAVDSFQTLWQSINGEESWQANPWVWVIEFTVHRQNVDDFLKARQS